MFVEQKLQLSCTFKCDQIYNNHMLAVQKLIGDNLKVVLAKLPTIIQAVFVFSATAWHGQEWPHLELKTQPRFCPVSICLSIIIALKFGFTWLCCLSLTQSASSTVYESGLDQGTLAAGEGSAQSASLYSLVQMSCFGYCKHDFTLYETSYPNEEASCT